MSDDFEFEVEPEEESKPREIPKAYEKLKALRTNRDLESRMPAGMSPTFRALDGTERPLKLRYYQVQGVLHLLAMPRFLLGDDTGLGKCVTRDTLVLTDRGLVEIGSLGPGGDLPPDSFHPPREPTRVWTGWKWAPVRSFYTSGRKPTRRVVTRRGYEVTGSEVHPLYVRGEAGEGFVPLRELAPGAYVAIDRSGAAFPETEPELPVPDPTTIDPHARVYPKVPRELSPALAALLGYVVAEGWTGSRWGFAVTQFRDLNPEVHDDIRHLFGEVLGWDGNGKNRDRDRNVTVSSVYLREYLHGVGVGYDLSGTKKVPWPIFRGTRRSVASFLRAFFDGEGSVSGGVVEVSSASERLLREIQILLLRFGIVCTRSPQTVKGRSTTYWRLCFCGDDARAFRREIGFLSPRKTKALDELCERKSNPNLDVIPHARGAVREIRSELLRATSRRGANEGRKGSGLKQFGTAFVNSLNNIETDGRNPTYGFLERLLDVARRAGVENTPSYRELESIARTRFFYDPIETIETGEDEVVDIEVDDADHSFVSNGLVSHNTIQAITALAFLWEKSPDLRAVILTSKSAVNQWAAEFERFLLPGRVRTFVCTGTPKQREKIREAYFASTGAAVLVLGYRTAVQDFSALQDAEGYVLVTDEATAFKNHQTQVHQAVAHLSSRASRTWALTATLIKNQLVEGWGIYRVVAPGLFGSYNAFLNDYCVTRMQALPGQRGPRARQVPVIVGYRPKDIARFREVIDPYFLGRPKFEVASELPPLETRTVKAELTRFQREKYEEALTGLLQVGLASGTPEEKEVTKLTAVTYCQQIVNHPGLIGCDGDSGKLDALLDLLDGDFAGEKVIVFSRFAKMIDILMPALKKAGIGAVRITGAENEKARKASQDAFQKPDSDVKVVCITTAAEEAINLQAAKAIIFYDTPWSGGSYIQILGRMIRIGSVHDRCYAIHLVAEKTIDERVMKTIASKMALIESVIGKRIKGVDDSDTVVSAENDLSDLFEGLVADAKTRRTAP